MGDVQVDKISISTPIRAIHQSIDQLNNGSTELEGGIRPGDRIDLVGASGSGKSLIMREIANSAIASTNSHVLYIDFDHRYNSFAQKHRRFHLIRAERMEDIIYTLEDWLIEHADIHVLWVMMDGYRINYIKYTDILTKLQKKWSFCLMTTTTYTKDLIATKENSGLWDYRLALSSQDGTNSVQLIWPMHMKEFPILKKKVW